MKVKLAPVSRAHFCFRLDHKIVKSGRFMHIAQLFHQIRRTEIAEKHVTF